MKAFWVAGLLLALSVPVLADDLCITLDASNVVVGKHFKIPKKNTCRPFTGSPCAAGLPASVSGDGASAATAGRWGSGWWPRIPGSSWAG